ncbi:hypothetical protein MMC27_008286 [Xylographa pallens]|nr:hypothetical protein [Xylographa pallens]
MASRPRTSVWNTLCHVKRPLDPSRPPLQNNILQARHQSQNPFAGRERTQYKRFNRTQSIRYLWQSSPAFRYGIGASGVGTVGFIGYNIETVPVSGRRRFNWVSPAQEEEMGKQQYEQVLQEFQRQLLPRWHPQTMMVHRVLERLIPASGLEGQAWEVHVIDDEEQMNAFVIPGGKVFVFSGLLPICDGEDGLATVLGHEIAHNVAHHAAENYSRLSLVLPLAYLVSFIYDVSGNLTFTLLDYAYNKPGSRKQESEADYIGLMMMAQSLFDPGAAVELWQRMEKANQVAIPQFLSTHPSNHNRIAKIQEWLPKARMLAEKSKDEHGTLF